LILIPEYNPPTPSPSHSAATFDVITVSSLEALGNPSAEIFHRTLRRLSVVPEQAIHVGDSPREDYQESENAGMTPVLIDRGGVFFDDGCRRIDKPELLVDLVICP
jgi:putative hydrolase of the HAD superfamily